MSQSRNSIMYLCIRCTHARMRAYTRSTAGTKETSSASAAGYCVMTINEVGKLCKCRQFLSNSCTLRGRRHSTHLCYCYRLPLPFHLVSSFAIFIPANACARTFASVRPRSNHHHYRHWWWRRRWRRRRMQRLLSIATHFQTESTIDAIKWECIPIVFMIAPQRISLSPFRSLSLLGCSYTRREDDSFAMVNE